MTTSAPSPNPAEPSDTPIHAPREAQALGDAFVAAFNAKDHDALAELFAEDGWFVDVVANRLASREAIRQAHRYAFGGPMARAVLEVTDRRTRRLGTDCVIDEISWTTTGHATPGAGRPAPPVRRGLLHLTAARTTAPGGWTLVSGINNDYTHAFGDRDNPFTQGSASRNTGDA